jgi:hypothetical protein
MSNFLAIGFGWLLGLLSPTITRAISRYHHAKEIKRSIEIELQEFIVQIAGIAYMTNIQYGYFDKDLVAKLIDIYAQFDRRDKKEKVLESLNRIRSCTDEDLQSIIAFERADPTSALGIGRLTLPYLESKIPELGLFPEEMQRKYLDLIKQVRFFNEQIDEYKFYFRLTYDGSISEVNHKQATKSVNRSYGYLAERSVLIIDTIIDGKLCCS